MSVPPMIGRIAVSAPFVGNADAPGKADPPVDDEQLAMRSIVEIEERHERRRVVLLHLDAGTAQEIEALAVGLIRSR
jgi:hypothetical protein